MSKISLQFTPSEVGRSEISPAIDVKSSRVSDFGPNSYKIDLNNQAYIIITFNSEIRYVSHADNPQLEELLVDAEKEIRENLDIDTNHFDLQIILEENPSTNLQRYHSQIEELASSRSLGQYDSDSLSSGSVRVSFSTNSTIIV